MLPSNKKKKKKKNKNLSFILFFLLGKMMYFTRDAIPQRWGNLQMAPISRRTEVREIDCEDGVAVLFFFYFFV
jgi:hypothetical protein